MVQVRSSHLVLLKALQWRVCYKRCYHVYFLNYTDLLFFVVVCNIVTIQIVLIYLFVFFFLCFMSNKGERKVSALSVYPQLGTILTYCLPSNKIGNVRYILFCYWKYLENLDKIMNICFYQIFISILIAQYPHAGQ